MAQINKPTDYFNTITYTGDGTSPKSITGVGFKPDWVWIKKRNGTTPHVLYDIVRGAGKQLSSNETSSQDTNNQYGYVSDFETDGYEVTQGSTSITRLNASSATYASWNWLAGGTPSSNTDGDVTSTVSANQTAGFSIVTVSNLNSNSFGHGLGAEPHLIFGKRTDDVANWRVYYKGITSGKSLFLNSSDALTTEASAIASANSSTVTVTGSGNGGTAGTGDAVYYCFAPIKGFSKIGTYTGNGNNDGVFIYTGFKPAFVSLKQTNGTNFWNIWDNKRDPFNAVTKRIHPNKTSAETSTTDMDFLSNGFKIRNSGGNQNASGSKYLYIAFAEQPLVGTNNIPATAR